MLPIFRTIHILSQRNFTLRRTRDKLLPKLVSGEIDVSSWVGEDVGEAARELAAVAARTTSRTQRMPEAAGSVEPIEKAAVEWDSLWG